jgi:hypothetical protein
MEAGIPVVRVVLMPRAADNRHRALERPNALAKSRAVTKTSLPFGRTQTLTSLCLHKLGRSITNSNSCRYSRSLSRCWLGKKPLILIQPRVETLTCGKRREWDTVALTSIFAQYDRMVEAPAIASPFRSWRRGIVMREARTAKEALTFPSPAVVRAVGNGFSCRREEKKRPKN